MFKSKNNYANSKSTKTKQSKILKATPKVRKLTREMLFSALRQKKFKLDPLIEKQKLKISKMPIHVKLVGQLARYHQRHLFRVAMYAKMIGKKLKLSEEEIDELAFAAFHHDLGKIWIPDEILEKPGKLTELEKRLNDKHAEFSADALKQYLYSDDFIKNYQRLSEDKIKRIVDSVKYHHENVDGSGTFRLSADKIPLFSKIIRIADEYDAMRMKRSYKDVWSYIKTKGQIKRDSISEKEVKAESFIYVKKKHDRKIFDVFNKLSLEPEFLFYDYEKDAEDTMKELEEIYKEKIKNP